MTVISVRQKEVMPLTKEYFVSHCLVCDEIPTATGNWLTHLTAYIITDRVLVEWRDCNKCNSKGTSSLVQFNQEWSNEQMDEQRP